LSQFAVEICRKFMKNRLLEVQGRSRSSMLINLKILLPVLVMISNMSVPICNRFHSRRANNGSPQWRFRGLSAHHFDTAHECGGQTDRWMPRWWLRRAKHFAIARNDTYRVTLSSTVVNMVVVVSYFCVIELLDMCWIYVIT